MSIGRELKVSHSYLSQVVHGKCPASDKVVSKMVSSGWLKVDDLGYNHICAEVAQVVEQRTENPRVSGSTPLLGTNYEVIERNKVSSRTPSYEGFSLSMSKGINFSMLITPKWRNGRRGSLKNCWGATPVSVRVRPSALQIEKLNRQQCRVV
jgi:hypothetical protein